MIRIICGTCGTSKGYKTAADGELTLPAAEEKRLVARGVAEYVTRPVMSPASDADSPVDDGDGGGTGINPPDEGPPVGGLENSGSDLSAGYLPGSVDMLAIVNPHFTKESLMEMRRPDMEKMAEDMGIDVSRCKNKGDIADLLAEIEIGAPAEDDGEVPPELGVEDPVV